MHPKLIELTIIKKENKEIRSSKVGLTIISYREFRLPGELGKTYGCSLFRR